MKELVLKFPNYTKRYNPEVFKYHANRSTKLLKIINRKNGLTELFRYKRKRVKDGAVIFDIDTSISGARR